MPDCGRFSSHQFWSKIPRAPLPSQTLSVSPEGPHPPLLVPRSHCGHAPGAKAGVYACASLSTNLDVSIPLSLVSLIPRGLEVAPRFPLRARPRPPESAWAHSGAVPSFLYRVPWRWFPASCCFKTPCRGGTRPVLSPRTEVAGSDGGQQLLKHCSAETAGRRAHPCKCTTGGLLPRSGPQGRPFPEPHCRMSRIIWGLR